MPFILLVSLAAVGQVRVPGPGGSVGSSPIAFTDVQQPVVSPASCTNCAVTLSQSIATGNILIVMANGYGNPVTISGVTGQSGLVHCSSGWNKGSSSTGYSDIAYVPSTTAQVSPVNVIFTGATGTTTNIQLKEVSVANGPASLDFCGSISNASNTTTQLGVGPTYSGSGTNKYTMQSCSTAAACNSVTGYTSLNANTNGQGWATQSNSNSVTAPSWTLSGAGVTETGAIGFAKSASGCENTVLVDFGGGTNGAQPTGTTLNNGTQPGHDLLPWAVTSTSSTYATSAKRALSNAPRFCDNGATYADISTLGWTFDISTTDNIRYGFVAFPDNITYAFYWKTSVPDNDNNHQYDAARAKLDVNGEAATFNIIGNGVGLKPRLEVSGGATLQSDCGTFGSVISGTWYWISLEVVRNTRYTMKVYDATTIGSLSLVCTTSGAVPQSDHPISNIELGHVGAVTGTGNMSFSQMKINRDAVYPLLN